MLNFVTLSVFVSSVDMLSVVVQSVITLSVALLSAIMSSVVLLNVVAPTEDADLYKKMFDP